MKTAKELCLLIVKYFFNFGNKQFLLLVSSPPIKVIAFLNAFFFKYLNFSRHRKDVSGSPKIMKLTLKKGVTLSQNRFFGFERSRDLFCIFPAHQIKKKIKNEK